MDTEEIKRKIAEDKERITSSYRRYPVRFIFLEMNNNTQDEIMDIVKSTGGELLELSDYIMNKDDGWLTRNRFVQIITEKTAKDKDTYVLGFSELIRFFSKREIESTVLSLFDIENSNITDPIASKRRIYLICFSMVDNVSRVLQSSFPRKEFLNPFINSDFEVSGRCREVCFVSNEYAKNIKKNKITTSVEWIGLWRHSELLDFSSPIWCCSESLYKWHKKASPDNAFHIDVVRDAKDYLRKAYDLEIDFAYDDADSVYWDRMKDTCADKSHYKKIHDLISDELNVDVYSPVALAGRYLIADDEYERWLIKNYVITYLPETFLASILKTLNSPSNKEFLISIWKQGYRTNSSAQFEERVAIIKELNKYSESFIPENEIQEIILSGVRKALPIDLQADEGLYELQLSELSDSHGVAVSDLRSRLQIYYLQVFKSAYTGLSKTEKEFIINLYSNGVLEKSEIHEVYPAFYYYLFGAAENSIAGKDEWKSYLQAYRESKISAKDNTYLKNYYDSGNANSTKVYSMYYELTHPEVMLAKYLVDSDIYILDGVGAEYLPLLIELIKNKGYMIEYCDYGVCHLPSITEVNKAYLSDLPYKEWVLSFDRDVIHGEYYKTTNNLRKAFDVLDRIVKDIVSDAKGRRIVITADHGATARAKWTDTKKKYSFENAHHEGRCCEIADKSAYTDNSDYIVFEDETTPGKPYVISINETSLYNRPRYEDHGGATVEEMLVPVIVAVQAGKEKKKVYKVISDKLEVTGLDRKVSFTIFPTPEEIPYVVENEGEKHPLQAEGNCYAAELITGREQQITVFVDGSEYTFRTTNKSKKNMEGDDGFDD